jgi:acetyl-CoA C-acetyltransferase
VLVVGAEKMNDVDSAVSTKFLAAAANYANEYGSTFPGLYALMAQAHMQQFGTIREHLSAVAVKNHEHSFSNPQAQYHKHFTLEQVSKSMPVADPLRLLDCSPITDGAAAVVLSSRKVRQKPSIVGFGQGQDSMDIAHRTNLWELQATKKAATSAYQMANLTADQIPVAEVHDCFTIAEILATEDLGFFEKGKGGVAVQTGKTTHGGTVVINPSGGLKACGHPVGATGVKQVAYLANLLEKGEYPYALAHNVGGSGATAVVHILKNNKKNK